MAFLPPTWTKSSADEGSVISQTPAPGNIPVDPEGGAGGASTQAESYCEMERTGRRRARFARYCGRFTSLSAPSLRGGGTTFPRPADIKQNWTSAAPKFYCPGGVHKSRPPQRAYIWIYGNWNLPFIFPFYCFSEAWKCRPLWRVWTLFFQQTFLFLESSQIR